MPWPFLVHYQYVISTVITALTTKEGTKRGEYSVRYYCQSGIEKPATQALTAIEQKQLDDIICKLLDNDVQLGIQFTLVDDILARSNVSK